MKKTLASLFAIALAASLTACGGGGSEPAPVEVVAADTTIPATAATAPAVVNVPFTFAAGVPDFGTTGTTTFAFTSTSTTPAFSIASGGNTATGTTTFGSCHFLVTFSTFPSTSKLALGQTITVDPCNITVNTAGTPANGVAAAHSAALKLGAAVSSGQSITVAVNPGGQLTLNGFFVGIVTLKPVT
jgi:predicted small lipoprotein YifL